MKVPQKSWAIIGLSAALFAGGLAYAAVGHGDESTFSEPLPPVKQTANALSATPTPIQGSVDCPSTDDICTVALALLSALGGRNPDPIVARLATLSVQCTTDVDIAPALQPQCAGGSANASGISITSKAKRLVSADEARQLIATRVVDLPSTTLHSVGIGCPQADAPDCSEYFAFAVGDIDREFSLTFVLRMVSGDWRIVGLRSGPFDYGALAGGWSNTLHPGTGLPTRMWFTTWARP